MTEISRSAQLAKSASQLVTPQDLGAVGDGIADDTASLNSFAGADGLQIMEGSFNAPSALTNIDPKNVLFTTDATINGSQLPNIAISPVGMKQLPDNLVYVRQDTSSRQAANTVRVERIVDTDQGLTNPKALRVATTVNTNTAQTEWAVSAELENRSDTSSTGNAALSGVSTKYGAASVFAGHFQAKDYNIFSSNTDVTSILGLEINTPVVGADHPTSNNNLGNRMGIDLIARTNEQVTNWDTSAGNSGDGEVGVGMRIRTDNSTKGYFRYGMVIDDVSQTGNTNPIGTGMLIRTSGVDGLQVKGANSAAGIRILPSSTIPFGMVIQGNYSTAALKLHGSIQMVSPDGNTTKTLSINNSGQLVFDGSVIS